MIRKLLLALVALVPMIATAQVVDLGDYPVDGTVYASFNTYDSNGASVTVTGLAVTDIEIYKNGSVTQRSSDSGYALLDTDGIDFDGTTGLHGFSIDLSDNTDAGFYAAGSQYWVNVNAITVDSQTVNFTYKFRILASGWFDLMTGTTELMTARQCGNALETTINGAPTSQTEFAVTAGASNDDAYNNLNIDIIGGTEECYRSVFDYDGATTTVTLDSACPFTIAASDTVRIHNGTAASQLTSLKTTTEALNNISTADLDQALVDIHLDHLFGTSGTCDSGSTTTCVDAARTEADNDYWQKGTAILFLDGTVAGQSACIYDFVAATDTITFRPAVTQAVATNAYVLLTSPICGGVAAP